MAKYLISFPSAAMVVPDGEWEAVGRDAHAVIDEAKAAGVYVFGGGIDEDVPPVLVSADGEVAEGGLSQAARNHCLDPCLPSCMRQVAPCIAADQISADEARTFVDERLHPFAGKRLRVV